MTVCHALVHKHYGRAWKALMASRDENGHTKENYAKCIEVRFCLQGSFYPKTIFVNRLTCFWVMQIIEIKIVFCRLAETY